MANHNKKYTGCHILYVCANISEMSMKDLAAYIGVTVAAIKKAITLWRNEGYPIAHQRIVQVGTRTIRNERGRDVAFIKTETGWERQGLDPSQYRYQGRQPGAKQKKPTKGKITTRVINDPAFALRQLPVKKEVKVFKNRAHEAKVPFYIPELRMIVEISPGADRQSIKAKYIDQRAKALKAS